MFAQSRFDVFISNKSTICDLRYVPDSQISRTYTTFLPSYTTFLPSFLPLLLPSSFLPFLLLSSSILPPVFLPSFQMVSQVHRRPYSCASLALGSNCE